MGFDVRDDTASTNGDGGADAIAPACTSFSPWSAAILVPGVDSALSEVGAYIQPDNRTLYLARSNEIYRSTRPDPAQPWSSPAPVSGLDPNPYDDPALPADELELYLTRFSPGACIWLATRMTPTAPWSTPVAQTAMCMPDGALCPHVTADGLRLYYTANSTIRMSTRASRNDPFGQGVDVLTGTGACPTLTSDELTMFYEAGMPLDIFETTRSSTAAMFPTGTPVAAVNTAAEDQDAAISPDGLELIVASDIGGADEKLYVTTRSCQ